MSTTSAITVQNFGQKAKSITTLGLKANTLAHNLGVFALDHAEKTGDVRLADRVYQAMQAGHLRAEGFRVWVEMFSPIRWNGDGKIGLLKVGSKLYTPYDVPTATARPFWTLEEANERAVKELSIEALIAMITKALKETDNISDDGFVYDKKGEPRFEAKGNVVAIKAFAAKMRAAATAAQASATTDAAVNQAIALNTERAAA